MKRIINILFLCVLISNNVQSQEIRNVVDSLQNSYYLKNSIHIEEDTAIIAVCPDESVLDVHKPYEGKSSQQTVDNKFLNTSRFLPICSYPFMLNNSYNWDLHEGLNLNLGVSMMCGIGKNSNNGIGFAQNLAAMYAMPITNKLSFAVGGFFNNINWNNHSYRDGGLNAVIGYQFDDHWEAYLYGQKSITKKRAPLPLYDINGLGDRIGAAIKYNFSPAFSIQVSVEERKY